MKTDQIPLGERAQKAIVDRILAVGDEAETDYLEVKSSLDLSQKHDLVKIAKFLLGAANRRVEDARKNFQGYAVMVLGASKDGCAGVTRGIEHHELEDRLSPYLGPDLPAFDLGRMALDADREVLFIFSPPPLLGQTIFPCRKDFHGEKGQERLDEGAIYVRGKSNTRPARAGEVLALVERARGGGKPPIKLDVQVQGNIPHVGRIEDVMDLLYEHEKDRYLAPRGDADVGSIGAAIGRSILRESDDRWRQARAAEWLSNQNQNRADGVEHLLGVAVPGSGLAITSIDRFVAKPHLIVTLGGCQVYDQVDIDDADIAKIVKPIPGQAFDSFVYPSFDAARYLTAPANYPIEWYNSDDAAVIVLTPESFRPNAQWVTDRDDYVLVVTDATATSIDASWILTEDGNDVVTTGNLQVTVGEPLDAGELVQKFFLRTRPS